MATDLPKGVKTRKRGGEGGRGEDSEKKRITSPENARPIRARQHHGTKKSPSEQRFALASVVSQLSWNEPPGKWHKFKEQLSWRILLSKVAVMRL